MSSYILLFRLPVSAPLSAQLRVERLHPINDEKKLGTKPLSNKNAESILNSGEQRRSVIELVVLYLFLGNADLSVNHKISLDVTSIDFKSKGFLA